MKNFSGLTITGATPDGYSVKANGYVEGSWLQSSVMQNYGSNTGKVCVFDNSGWIYYRTPAEIVAEAGGGGGSTEVVQTTGTSTTSVMSQKATTDELAKKANLNGGNTFSGVQTINAPTDVSGSEQTTMKVKTSNGGAIIFGKEGANSGTMIRLDQTDGTCRLRFGSSKTAGAMVWEQPEQGAQLYVDLGARGGDYHRVQFPSGAGTLALTSQIPTVNNGKLTIQKNGTDVATFGANQKDGITANITVPTKASDIDALSLNGGTIKKSKTIKMDASANSDGANLKWGTVNSKNPYIGYASDQVDGTFVVGSLLGTNYASGLAIGGGSGNLLWKGTKVATTGDIPTVNNGTLTIQKNGTTVATFSANQSGNATANITVPTFSLSGTTLTITI